MIADEVLQRQIRREIPGRANLFAAGRQAARDILLLGTTANLSPWRKERISRILAGPLDWKYFLNLADLHGITPLLAHNLTNNFTADRIPENYLKQLRQIYTNNLFRNVTLSNELKKVLSVFSQHGIPAIVLKGTPLAEYLFGNPGLRSVGDMDILVPPEKLNLAGFLLMEMGYRQTVAPQAWEHPFHEAPYCKLSHFPLIIELHWNLDDERLVAFPQNVFWHRARWLQIQESPIKVLSPEDYLVYLSNHLFKHTTHRLRLLNDIAELLKKHNGTLDWNYIRESTCSWEIETVVYYALKRAQELLGAPLSASIIRSLKPKAWRRRLLDFLVSAEFFIYGTKLTRLRDNTFTLARGLMMRHPRQTALVLAKKYRNKRGVWPRVIIWVILVLAAALGRAVVRVAAR
jgi:hypothetical protein